MSTSDPWCCSSGRRPELRRCTGQRACVGARSHALCARAAVATPRGRKDPQVESVAPAPCCRGEALRRCNYWHMRPPVDRDPISVEAVAVGGAGRRDARVPDPVERARSLSSVEEVVALYGEWASSYDDDVFGELGFTGSVRIAELLAGVLPDLDQPVVDLGCGTGAVGRRLAQLGVTTVDGVDLSPEMLTFAARTGAYRNLTIGDLHDLPQGLNATYAAAVSAGTFTTGHVGSGAVPRLIELLRPGGFVAWVIAAGLWAGFERVLATNRLDVLHQTIEPIRRDGSPEAVMFVARLSDTP